MTRPRVTLKCVADNYADKSRERIVEFFDPVTKQGGLIAFRRVDDELRVDVYQVDAKVSVNVSHKDAPPSSSHSALTFPLPVGTRVKSFAGEEDEGDEGPRKTEPNAIGVVTAARWEPRAADGEHWHHDVTFEPSGVWVILYEFELADPAQYEVIPAISEEPAQ